ncbi:S-adenosyl-L-methionine-dependent methyltransferase [Apiospora marii]|uniref:S-adenosyl-L-methionine-dependent methyltransferase n=1 Tax=Apiospora marii TaxID=335849 RepID=A0ABR1RHV5_9PEZI
MPRLPPSLIQRARSISPRLATLLPACRDLDSARNELRWIRDHVAASTSTDDSSCPPSTQAAANPERRSNHERKVASLCRRRARGEPLQYLLGSQPFGPLDIQCRRGVLIPRPETETWTYALASEVVARLAGTTSSSSSPEDAKKKEKTLRIVDFCTGTGCIPLLLYALLHRRFRNLQVWGFDVEERAVRLARENLRYNVARGLLPSPLPSPGEEPSAATARSNRAENDVRFEVADIFADDWLQLLPRQDGGTGGIDVLVSNPPYISTKGFNRDTGRSVRNHEPKLALVPYPRPNTASDLDGQGAAEGCAPEDVFYERLCEVARILKPKIMLFEVGDLDQALRVAQMAVMATGEKLQDLEIWRDCPDVEETEPTADSEQPLKETYIEGRKVLIKGSGHGRSVFVHLG